MIVCCPMSLPTEPSEIWGCSWGSTQHTMKCHKCRPNPFVFFFLLAKTSELLKFWRGYWSSHKRRTQFLRLYAYGHVNEHNALWDKAEGFLTALCKIWVRKSYWRRLGWIFRNISSTVRVLKTLVIRTRLLEKLGAVLAWDPRILIIPLNQELSSLGHFSCLKIKGGQEGIHNVEILLCRTSARYLTWIISFSPHKGPQR